MNRTRNLLLAAMVMMSFVARADADVPQNDFLPMLAVLVLAVVGAVILGFVAWLVRRGSKKKTTPTP